MYTYLIDTHTHLYAEEFNDDRLSMLQRAQAAGVERFYLPNVDVDSIAGMLELEAMFPNVCFAMMGLHPCSVTADYQAVLEKIEQHLRKRPFCAVGEIGLDYYWSKEFVLEQQDAFLIQSRWAKELDIPIVIHGRDSLDDLIQLVEQEKTDTFRGIFHCFNGTLAQAQQIIELGFLLGIGGVLTFKNSGLDKVVEQIDLQHLVLETDSPYLAPVPYRGKRNESAYLALIAQKLATIKNIDYQEVVHQTTQNALQLFHKQTILV